MSAVNLWRCSRCGKWSHAARKPKWHERFEAEPNESDVIVREIAGYEPGTGAWEPSRYIRCGPFESWVATKGDKT